VNQAILRVDQILMRQAAIRWRSKAAAELRYTLPKVAGGHKNWGSILGIGYD
jgi:hypothetical protein